MTARIRWDEDHIVCVTVSEPEEIGDPPVISLVFMTDTGDAIEYECTAGGGK